MIVCWPLCCKIVLVVWLLSSTFSSSSDSFETLLETYKSFHSKDALDADPRICDRNFVVGTYACPSMVGNHLHEFMNAWAGALVTNRTLLWSFCERKPCLADDEESCGQFLTRLPWVAAYKPVYERWKQAGCSSSRTEHVQVVGFRNRYAAEKILACCGLTELTAAFVDFGGMDRREMFSLSLAGAALDSRGRRVADILFGRGEDRYKLGLLLPRNCHNLTRIFTPGDTGSCSVRCLLSRVSSWTRTI